MTKSEILQQALFIIRNDTCPPIAEHDQCDLCMVQYVGINSGVDCSKSWTAQAVKDYILREYSDTMDELLLELL